MGALNEVLEVRQIPDEPRRRWFRSDNLDLIVWCDESGTPRGFQLCYDKPRSEHALTWLPEFGFLHAAVDDGEDVGFRHKETPILVADGPFHANRVRDRFAGASAQMPPEIVGFVDTKLRQHPDYVPRAETNGGARATATTPSGAHEAPPSTNPEMRGGGEHSRNSGEFPVGWIPIIVPMLAVLLAVIVYFILGAVL